MTKDQIMAWAREADINAVWDIYVDLSQFERFAQLVAQAEREECASIAGELHQGFLDTKDAHERLSPKPFMPERFGFDHALIWQSQKIADAIRERKNK